MEVCVVDQDVVGIIGDSMDESDHDQRSFKKEDVLLGRRSQSQIRQIKKEAECNQKLFMMQENLALVF